MTALVLEAHNDDAVLFSAWNAIRHRAHVVTVLRSVVQAATISASEREFESDIAARELGCTWEQWGQPDDAPDWTITRDMLVSIGGGRGPVFAPWPEKGGHEHHNRLGELARDVFGDRVRFYATYRVGGPKTVGREVPYEREWIAMKLRALACFRSQIERGPHRFFLMDLREYEMPA